jgi:hypothetical protein
MSPLVGVRYLEDLDEIAPAAVLAQVRRPLRGARSKA